MQALAETASAIGHTVVVADGGTAHVPYATTGMLCQESGEGPSVFWGGAEPQENPRA